MPDWKPFHEEPPPIGCRFVVLFNDGSGARMYWRHDAGYIDCDGEEVEDLSSESFDLWTQLPDGKEFWCEVRSDEPMSLSLPPAQQGGSDA